MKQVKNKSIRILRTRYYYSLILTILNNVLDIYHLFFIPSHIGKLYKPSLHLSQVIPIKFGLHLHFPSLSHDIPIDPWLLHSQAEIFDE